MALVTIARALMTIVNLNDGKKGDKGDRGDKGEAALTLSIEPKTFVFETDDKGIVLVGNKRATIALYEGTQRVTPDKVTLKMDGCNAEVVNKAILNFKAINPNTYSGYVEVTATCKGQVRTATAEFMVSAQKWNEANFLANEQQFQSIIIQNKADKQGLEKRMSTIEHDAKGIRLEVSKQTFSGVNMLKGASLRLLDLLSLQRAQYVTIGNDASVAHLDNPYVAIVRHGAPQKEWNGCKFPVTKAIGGRTYTVSMFTRIYGRYQPYLEIKRSRSKDMTDPKTDCPDIPSTWGQWKQYTHTFDLEEGYNYLQIFIGFTRDGEAYLSEIQLEEGNKATVWKDPDKDESFKRAGIDLDLEHIVLQAGKVYTKNAKGETTSLVDEEGNFATNTLQTFNKQGGSVYIHDGIIEVRNPSNITQIKIGYDPKEDKTVMSFFNKLGLFIADLDPSALRPEDVTQARWEPIKVTQLSAIASDTALEAIKNDTWLMSRIIGLQVETFRFEDLYIYTAPMIQGSFRPDGQWNGEQTKANNKLVFKGCNTYNNEKANGIFIMEYFFTRPRIPLRDKNGVEHPIEIIPEFVIIKDGKWEYVREPELSNPHFIDF